MHRAPLLQIAQDVATSESLGTLLTLFPAIPQGNVSHARLLLAAQMTSEELAMRYDWAMQRRQWTFAMSPGGRQPLPEDFSRIVPGTLRNLSSGLYVRLSEPQEWANRLTVPPVDDTFRVVGNEILMWPIPLPGTRYVMEYIGASLGTRPENGPFHNGAYSIDAWPSRQTGGGVRTIDDPVPAGTRPSWYYRFDADDNVPVWPSPLMRAGMIYHFRTMESLDAAAAAAIYQTAQVNYMASQPTRPWSLAVPDPCRANHAVDALRHRAAVAVVRHPVAVSYENHVYAPSTQFHSHTHVSETSGGGATPAPRTWNTGATAPTDQENWLGWWPPAQPDGTRPRYVWDGAWVQDL